MEHLLSSILPYIHTWFVFIIIAGAIIAYANDKIPLELVSVTVISLLITYFTLFPMLDDKGNNLLSIDMLFQGFSNSALITVMCLLVVGQAVVMSGAVNEIGQFVAKVCRNKPYASIALMLILAAIVSAFMNNTPVVVIFIPILGALAKRVGLPASSVMMPLAFAASLGGMTTLVGTSTNLLISGKMQQMGFGQLGFFDFTIPGIILASVGMIYVVFILPRLLPDRSSLITQEFMAGEDTRQFVAEIEITTDSILMGKPLDSSELPLPADVRVKLVQREEHAFLPPFEKGVTLQPGDIVVIAATRKALSDMVQNQPNLLVPDADNFFPGKEVKGKTSEGLNLSELVIAPSSRMVGQTIETLRLRSKYNVVVLGIQRGTRTMRSKISLVRLQAGDVMLVLAPKASLQTLGSTKDVLLLEPNQEELPNKSVIKRVNLIFFSVIGLAAFEIVPIQITSFVGATLLVLTGCLNIRQALRALDKQIFFVIATAYMLSLAMEKSGGAELIANTIAGFHFPPIVAMALLFFVMIIFNEIMSNNAAGLLFTPIALNMAQTMDADPRMFIWGVIFAGSCSFATPIGYQTNLMVMGPGHYKFSDYIKAGIPLNLIIWIGYIIFSLVYFR